MTLNPDVIRARCAEIDSSLSRLEELRRLPRETVLSDQDTLDIACYRLLIATEAAPALCSHVSAKRPQQVPEEYAGCSLERAGLFRRIFPFACNRRRASETCRSTCTGKPITAKSTR